jgi:ectoine hydroxylase-related dioxygenase (phytanoyl-CoA dioxygenase family)
MIDAFSKVWGTKELLVSFDGMNFTLPSERMPPSEPWPHVDQNPKRKGMQCVQGILNLAPNGPQDGGLLVMKGSHKLNELFFKSHPEVVGRSTWGSLDWFGFSKEEVAWFEKRGCELIKVCAEPGDLILWDSRTIHHNKLPDSQNLRAVMYICYTPAASATKENLEMKAGYFRQRLGTVSTLLHVKAMHLTQTRHTGHMPTSSPKKISIFDLESPIPILGNDQLMNLKKLILF